MCESFLQHNSFRIKKSKTLFPKSVIDFLSVMNAIVKREASPMDTHHKPGILLGTESTDRGKTERKMSKC